MKIIKNWKKILICSVATVATIFGTTMSLVGCGKAAHEYVYRWGLNLLKILNDFEEIVNHNVEINGVPLKNKDIIDYDKSMGLCFKDSLFDVKISMSYDLNIVKQGHLNGDDINWLFTQLCYFDSISDVKISNFAAHINERVKVGLSFPVQEKFQNTLGSTMDREYSFWNFSYSIVRTTYDLVHFDVRDEIECSLYDIPFDGYREQLKTKRFIDDLTGKISYNYSYFVNPNQKSQFGYGYKDEDEYKKYLGLTEWK